MLTTEITLMLVKEKQKEINQALEYRQLLLDAGLQHSTTINAPSHALAWLGEQMIRLGTKLQSFDAAPASDNLVIKKA
jgi:hypothetical protein